MEAKNTPAPATTLFANPMVVLGLADDAAAHVLKGMGSELKRLYPDATALTTSGQQLCVAAKSGSPGEFAKTRALFVRVNAGVVPGMACEWVEKLFQERSDAGLLTVIVTPLARPGRLVRFCRGLLGAAKMRVSRVGETGRCELAVEGHAADGAHRAEASRIYMAWSCDNDCLALGAHLVQALWCPARAAEAPSVVRALQIAFGHVNAIHDAGVQPPRCCPNRRSTVYPAEFWEGDGERGHLLDLEVGQVTVRCTSIQWRRRVFPDCVRLDLRLDHFERLNPHFVVRIGVAPELTVRVRYRDRWRAHAWNLRVGTKGGIDEAFLEARRWMAAGFLFGSSKSTCGTDGHGARAFFEAGRTLRQVLRRTTEAAIRMLDAEVRRVVLRFLTEDYRDRIWLYNVLVADTSGRLLQLARVSPGTLTFAHSLMALGRHAGMADAGAKLLQDVRSGRGLDQSLDDALAVWAACARKASRSLRIEPRLRAAWRRLAGAQGDELHDILRGQRLLIRRAGSGVPSATLWTPPPLRFAPEDIPKEKCANRRWYRVVKAHPVLLGGLTDETRDGEQSVVLSLAEFLSRHAVSFDLLNKIRYDAAGDRIQMALAYSLTTGYRPTRDSSPSRYWDTVEDWYYVVRRVGANNARHLVGEDLVGADGNPLPLPEPPCPGWHSADWAVLPLRTTADVAAEGMCMENCVAERTAEVIAGGGGTSLYHAEACGPMTIQLVRTSQAWALAEARGPKNRLPTKLQARALSEFIRHLNCRSGCRCPRPGADVAHEDPEVGDPRR